MSEQTIIEVVPPPVMSAPAPPRERVHFLWPTVFAVGAVAYCLGVGWLAVKLIDFVMWLVF